MAIQTFTKLSTPHYRDLIPIQTILDFGIPFPYPDKKNYVFTTKPNLEDTEYVNFVSGDIIPFIHNLKNGSGKDIWLIGGGKLITALFNAGLIDEFQIFVMPIVIGEGIPLFDLSLKETMLKLVDCKTYRSGVVQLTYIKNTEPDLMNRKTEE